MACEDCKDHTKTPSACFIRSALLEIFSSDDFHKNVVNAVSSNLIKIHFEQPLKELEEKVNQLQNKTPSASFIRSALFEFFSSDDFQKNVVNAVSSNLTKILLDQPLKKLEEKVEQLQNKVELMEIAEGNSVSLTVLHF